MPHGPKWLACEAWFERGFGSVRDLFMRNRDRLASLPVDLIGWAVDRKGHRLNGNLQYVADWTALNDTKSISLMCLEPYYAFFVNDSSIGCREIVRCQFQGADDSEALLTLHHDFLADISGLDGFLYATIVNNKYQVRQNTEDPNYYVLTGLPVPSLPLITNGLGRQVYDISRNPGFRKQGPDYAEVIGFEMWLGPGFFRTTGADRAKVETSSWLEIMQHPSGTMVCKAWPTPFENDDGEEAQVQRQLRQLLFPSAREALNGPES